MTTLTDRPRHHPVLDRGRYARLLAWLDQRTARARRRRRASLARRLTLRAARMPGHWVPATDVKVGEVILEAASGPRYGAGERVLHATPAAAEGVVEISTDTAEHDLPACDWVRLAQTSTDSGSGRMPR
ncbi:hypothetical protein DMC64_41870 [Amycolatopsis sp. WAC 04197]|uniref:hypothetical protein n=1 Tax=Amycolatopsis sp. WAC 04197 TaxID=2203199 RepID=UPI000F7B167E|nr:hypothetical protein [Amycolatopsis sp. WAC 04197]RSN38617.1 hypothetical protein DMC64_41870 [Amycolatopsis sp. WAC 04197]